jgi:hypothetical protein
LTLWAFGLKTKSARPAHSGRHPADHPPTHPAASQLSYFAGVAETDFTAAFFVDLAFVPLCFEAFVLFTVEALFVVAGAAAAFGAGAGVPCAAKLASASAMVIPIAEIVLFIVLSVLFFGSDYLVRFCL